MLGTKIRPPKLSGKYNIVKRRNGKVLQDVTFYNTFTRSFLTSGCFTGNYPSYYNLYTLFSYCIVGSGSTVPSSTDTRITTPLWVIAVNSYSKQGTSQDKLSRTWRFIYVIPASSRYVGTIREIGLTDSSFTNSTIFTHALVKDSEGIPIDINKTELDEVTITVDITITRPSWRTGQTWAFWGQFYANIFRTLLSTYSISNSNGSGARPAAGITNCWYPEGCPGMVGTLSANPSANISGNQVSFRIECNSTCLQAGFLSASKTPFRSYVNSLYLGCICTSSGSVDVEYNFIPVYRVLMPNAAVFPVTTLEGLSLGTGDGSTTDFAPELPAWLANTEKVYKNGTLLTRGVDYLVDNLANRSGARSVSICNFVCDISGAEVKPPVSSTIAIFGTGSTFNGRSAGVANEGGSSIATTGLALKKDTPIILTYNTAAAFTDKFNRYRLGVWTCFDSSGSSAVMPNGTSIVFYYSTDNGSTWTELDRIVKTSHNSYEITDQNDLRILPAAIEGLTNIKIELESDSYNGYACVKASGHGFIGYVGEYAIRFLTPPAADDILTMDLDIDRPWKSPDTIIQWNPILSFNL